MKTLLLVMITAGFFSTADAQYSKYIIRLKDKAGTTFTINQPQQYLSARAIERRKRYNLAIDSTDLPVSTKYIDSIRSKGNVKVLSTSKWLNQVLIETTDANALNQIQALPFVKEAYATGLRPKKKREKFHLELPVQSLLKTSQTLADNIDYGQAYSQVHIHEGEYLHNLGFKGENMIIAVLDAGFFQYKNIALFDSIRNNGQVLGERDFVAFDNSTNEDDAHGMHVLGVLAANHPGQMVGTAPKAKYWLIRTENAGSEYPIEEHNWVAGAEFADSAGADMISSSLGYYDFQDASLNHSYNEFYTNSTTVTQGATWAAHKGIIVMNSAGNEGNSAWKYIIFPADADSVCTVGAVNKNGAIASFSSWGYPGKVKPNIVSVGQGTVVASAGGPALSNGTSFSNPNIAGLIACLWQAFPEFNNMKILEAVYKSSDRYTSPDDRYGYGIPNMRLAYEMLETAANKQIFKNSYLAAYPVPFNDKLSIRILAPETGTVSVRLVDALGRTLAAQQLVVSQNMAYNVTFTVAAGLPKGVYFVRYNGKEKATLKVLRQ